MFNIRTFSILTLCTVMFHVDAQELPVAPSDHSNSIEFQVTDSEQLLRDGWQQATADIWRKTMDDGTEVELAFGLAGVERSLGWLEQDIARLSQQESTTLSEDAKLLDLLDQREKLEGLAVRLESDSSLSDSDSAMVCSGTATFTHEYGWYSNSSPYVNSDSRWYRTVAAVHSTQAYAVARIVTGSGTSYQSSYLSPSTTDWTVSAFAGISPSTWSCTASAYGYVFASGGCYGFASHTSSKNCNEIPR